MVHQLHREPKGWDRVLIPKPIAGGTKVALVLGVSATVTDYRRAAGARRCAAIWAIEPEVSTKTSRAGPETWRRSGDRSGEVGHKPLAKRFWSYTITGRSG